jgi:hypothetical protein
MLIAKSDQAQWDGQTLSDEPMTLVGHNQPVVNDRFPELLSDAGRQVAAPRCRRRRRLGSGQSRTSANVR